MRVSVDLSALGKTKWHEYAVRFLFGGIVTAVTGIIAHTFGPVVGGLFLAFPAIFPAGVTLVEKHERQKKERAGLHGSRRGRQAASIDAAGAAMGSIGLLVFALVVWRAMPRSGPLISLCAATIAWLAASVLAWRIRKG